MTDPEELKRVGENEDPSNETPIELASDFPEENISEKAQAPAEELDATAVEEPPEPVAATAETPAEPSAPDTDPAAHDELVLTDDDEEANDEGHTEQGDPWGGHSPETVKKILEAGVFAAGTALSVAQLAALFEEHERPHRKIIRTLMVELMSNYQGGGVELVEVASGYRFQTQAELGPWVSRLWDERPQKYSRALLETLALIAYRQPITRSEIEEVRGVSVSSSIIRTLLEREWVRVVGHRDVPGRPAMYATTRQLLDYFGLRSLDQLPSLGEILDMEDIHPELELGEPDRDSAGAVDKQAEISFSSMVDKMREGERTGKTGNEFIDDQLDDQLSEMDAVNEAIEQAFEAQRAEHNQPALDLADEEEDSEAEGQTASDDAGSDIEPEEQQDAPDSPEEDAPSDEAEQWRIIQEKLAQQQALLDARESDQSGGDSTDE